MPENIKANLLKPALTREAAGRSKTEKNAVIKRGPTPFISRQAPALNISIVKQLSAYPNYGNPSKSADILYTGNKSSWDIEIPQYLLAGSSLKAKLIIRAALDDHTSVAAGRYTMKIYANGLLLYKGHPPLEHGTPSGSVFTNWKELSFNLRTPIKDNKIVIENTSACGVKDWIGLDRIELRLYPA